MQRNQIYDSPRGSMRRMSVSTVLCSASTIRVHRSNNLSSIRTLLVGLGS